MMDDAKFVYFLCFIHHQGYASYPWKNRGYICAHSTAPLGNTISQTAIWAVFSTQCFMKKMQHISDVIWVTDVCTDDILI